MSDNELKKHVETISEMAPAMQQVANRVGWIFKYGAWVCAGFTFLGTWAGMAIGAYKWNENLVKKPQFAQHETKELRVDSALNTKIDTGLLGVRSEIYRNRFTNVTQYRDKKGNISYAPYNN